MNKGFTLIELLVVVLIIGILAAIAVPQYEKAVERSRSAQALSLLKAVGQAFETHYLANGTYAHSFDELALDIPWTGNTKYLSFEKDTRSNGQWSLGIEDTSGYTILRVGRIGGKYKGSSFSLTYETPAAHHKGLLRCAERKSGGNFLFDTSLPAGAYCAQVMKGTLSSEDSWSRIYNLP